MRSAKFNRWLLLGLCITGLSAAITLTAIAKDKDKDETEVKIKLDDVPPPVKATLIQEAFGVPLTDVEKETDDGKTVYEADAKIANTPYEIKVAGDGTLISKKIDKEDDEKDGDKKDKD
jgi:uncharacterized membrane protein YkoI